MPNEAMYRRLDGGLSPLCSLFLVPKEGKKKMIGGQPHQMMRMIADAGAANAWTKENSSFEVFTLFSLFQTVSNVYARAGKKPIYAESLDLRHWFFQIGCPPSLSTMFMIDCGDGLLYYPVALPMGWKCSPQIAQAVTWALVLGNDEDGRTSPYIRMPNDQREGTPRYVELLDAQKNVVGGAFVLLDNVFVISSDEEVTRSVTEHFRKNCKRFDVIVKNEETLTDLRSIQTLEFGSDVTIEFCGVEVGHGWWRTAAKTYRDFNPNVPRKLTHRQCAGYLGKIMWDLRVRLVDMLTTEMAEYMALYRKVTPDEKKWDDMMELEENEQRLLHKLSVAAQLRQKRVMLPYWTVPTNAAEILMCACDAAGENTHGGYSGMCAVFIPGDASPAQAPATPEMYSWECVKGLDIAISELLTIERFLTIASRRHGWNEVTVVVVGEDNTNVESWIEKRWTYVVEAREILIRVLKLLNGRRMMTVRLASEENFSDLGTRDVGAGLGCNAEWMPSAEMWSNPQYQLDYKKRWTATVVGLRQGMKSMAMQAENGPTFRGRRDDDEN